jgi:hypothetical protein
MLAIGGYQGRADAPVDADHGTGGLARHDRSRCGERYVPATGAVQGDPGHTRLCR